MEATWHLPVSVNEVSSKGYIIIIHIYRAYALTAVP